MQECSNCLDPVKYSIVVTISSLGVRPRIQRYSRAVQFCERCFSELTERLCSDTLRATVNSALTELNQRLHENTSTANDAKRA
jgi:hypothetical protein